MIPSSGSFIMRSVKNIDSETGTVYGASFLLAKHSNSRVVAIVISTSVAFSCMLPSLQAAAKTPKIKPEMVQEQLATRIALQSADSTLRAALATAGSDFSSLSHTLHHFPREESEEIESLRKLQALAEKNPYAKNEMLRGQITQFGEGCAIGSLTTDLTLSESSVRDLQKFPPPEWQAYPGSISIVHNGADIFLVWAAGLDGKPLRSVTNSGIALESRQVFFHKEKLAAQ
jgi:hypothetical protein